MYNLRKNEFSRKIDLKFPDHGEWNFTKFNLFSILNELIKQILIQLDLSRPMCVDHMFTKHVTSKRLHNRSIWLCWNLITWISLKLKFFVIFRRKINIFRSNFDHMNSMCLHINYIEYLGKYNLIQIQRLFNHPFILSVMRKLYHSINWCNYHTDYANLNMLMRNSHLMMSSSHKNIRVTDKYSNQKIYVIGHHFRIDIDHRVEFYVIIIICKNTSSILWIRYCTSLDKSYDARLIVM